MLIDIHPVPDGLGTPLSRGGTSCFNGRCLPGSYPNRSDSPSAGIHRESLGKNVFTRVDIAVMDGAACWARPEPAIK
jgi:hypothetical protein